MSTRPAATDPGPFTFPHSLGQLLSRACWAGGGLPAQEEKGRRGKEPEEAGGRGLGPRALASFASLAQQIYQAFLKHLRQAHTCPALHTRAGDTSC